VTQSNDDRIARDEAAWNAPRLFTLGFGFLAACIVLIYVLASL
jgi:hypothetical protein